MSPFRPLGIESVRWEGVSHERIHRDFHSHPGDPSRLHNVSDEWIMMADLLDQVVKDAKWSLNAFFRNNAGQALDVSRIQLENLVEWLEHIAMTCRQAGKVVFGCAEQFVDVRNRVEPPRASPVDDGRAPSLAWAHVGDAEQREAVAREAQQRARDLMTRWESSASQVAHSVPTFPSPPGALPPLVPRPVLSSASTVPLHVPARAVRPLVRPGLSVDDLTARQDAVIAPAVAAPPAAHAEHRGRPPHVVEESWDGDPLAPAQYLVGADQPDWCGDAGLVAPPVIGE